MPLDASFFARTSTVGSKLLFIEQVEGRLLDESVTFALFVHLCTMFVRSSPHEKDQDKRCPTKRAYIMVTPRLEASRLFPPRARAPCLPFLQVTTASAMYRETGLKTDLFSRINPSHANSSNSPTRENRATEESCRESWKLDRSAARCSSPMKELRRNV